MPHPATSPPADAQVDTAELTDAPARHRGFDVVYEVDIELLRGCRHPLGRYGAGTGHAEGYRRAAVRRGAR